MASSRRTSRKLFSATSISLLQPGEIPDLTNPDPFSDVCLIVEEKRLYTNRAMLASASPVWRTMFTSGFKEKHSAEIPLPEKSFEAVNELLLSLLPGVQKPLNGKTAMLVLPLVDEYQILNMKEICERCLLSALKKSRDIEEKLVFLTMAQRYKLPNLLEVATGVASRRELASLQCSPSYADIDDTTLIVVLKKRVVLLEDLIADRLLPERQQIKNETESMFRFFGKQCTGCSIHSKRIADCDKCSKLLLEKLFKKFNFLLNKTTVEKVSNIEWANSYSDYFQKNLTWKLAVF